MAMTKALFAAETIATFKTVAVRTDVTDLPLEPYVFAPVATQPPTKLIIKNVKTSTNATWKIAAIKSVQTQMEATIAHAKQATCGSSENSAK